MQPADVNPSMYIDFNIEKNKESPKFKFVIIECKVCDNRMLKCIYIYIYIYLQKITLQIGLNKFLWLEKLQTLSRGHLITDLKGGEIFGTFCSTEKRQ